MPSSTKHSRQISSRRGLIEAIASMSQPLIRGGVYHPICLPIRCRCDYSFDNLVAVWVAQYNYDPEWQALARAEYAKYDLNLAINVAHDAFMSALIDSNVQQVLGRSVPVELVSLDSGEWISLQGMYKFSFLRHRYDWVDTLKSRQHFFVRQMYQLVSDLSAYLQPDKIKWQLEMNAAQYIFEDISPHFQGRCVNANA